MDVLGVYKNLRKIYGRQNWWPVDYNKTNPAFEISVGAILTQNTSWNNVKKALKCLHDKRLLSAKAVITCPDAKLEQCIRPSGYYKQKTKKLKVFCLWLMDGYMGNLKKFFKKSLSKAREELLQIWGIGPETADSILLYAGHKPVFVVDAYTGRLCAYLGRKFKTYDSCQKFFESKLPKSAKLFNEYHALIVASGKDKHKLLCQKGN